MYCPVCFNGTLKLATSGVINVVINDKKMDTGRFLFNLNSETKDMLQKKLKQKLVEFFDWYAKLNNKGDIEKVKIYSTDFVCENSCSIPLNCQLSVVGNVFPEKFVMDILKELAQKNSIGLNVKSGDL